MISENEHIEHDMLEEYALGHLSEAEEEAVEEHLLLCHECQDKLAEVDDYIRAVRVAAPAVAGESSFPKPSLRDRIGKLTGSWARGKPIYAAAALAAVLAIILWLPERYRAEMSEVQVSLEALRGDGEPFAEGEAGTPIALNMNLHGLEATSKFVIEIADEAGSRVWRGRIDTNGAERFTVKPDTPLWAGTYWVRLYDEKAPSELLREYALKMKPAK